MKLGRVAIDGSKAESERKQAQGDELPADAGAGTTTARGGAPLLQQAESIDAEEDAEYGPDNRRGDELPAELAAAGRTFAEASAKRSERWKNGPEPKAGAEGKGEEEPKKVKPERRRMQYNFSDPESRILKGADGFLQGYNAQIAVEPDSATDRRPGGDAGVQRQGQLLPMVEVMKSRVGKGRMSSWPTADIVRRRT